MGAGSLDALLSKDTALIVDSSGTAPKTLVTILRDYLNCQNILEASDGQAALAMFSKHSRIDWVFSDWEIPGLSGDQLLAEVRKNPESANIPFIMVTSRSDRDSLATAVQLGVTSYVIKPFTANTLVEKIRMAMHRMERRNAERIKVTQGTQTKLKFKNFETTSSTLLDISLSGALVLAALKDLQGLSIFTLGDIEIHLPKGVLSLPVQVIRMEADPLHPGRTDQIRVAVRFQPMERETRSGLVKMIEGLRRAQLG